MTRTRDWFIVCVVDGIIRREPTMKACLEWADQTLAASDAVLPDSRRMPGGFYRCLVGSGVHDRREVWIARGDIAAWRDFDLGQEPLYPYADQPYVRGDRTPENR